MARRDDPVSTSRVPWLRKSIRVLGSATLLLPLVAAAYVQAPTIIPANPRSGENIAFTVRAGGCHSLLAPPPPNDAWREVQRSGDVVRVTMLAILNSSPFCVNPTTFSRISIGALPPGDYTLELYGRLQYETPGGPVLLASTDFQVAGSDPVAIPAANESMLLLLAALFACIGAVRASYEGGTFGFGGGRNPGRTK